MRKTTPIILSLSITFLCIIPTLVGMDKGKTDSLISVLNNSIADSSRVIVLQELAKTYFLEDLSLALDYAKKAIEVARKPGLEIHLKESVKLAGTICFNAGLIDLALNYMNWHLRLIGKDGPKNESAIALNNLGAIRLILSDFEQAKKYQLAALKNLEEFASENQEDQLLPQSIFIYNNLGIIYREQKNYEKALFYFDRGIAKARQKPDQATILVKLLNNRAMLLLKIGDTKAAEGDLKESLALTISSGDKLSESATLLNLGLHSREMGDNKKALHYLESSLQQAFLCKSHDMIYNASHQLSALYKITGPSDSTLKYLTLSQEYLDKLNLAKAREEVTREELLKEFKEKEQAEERKKKKRDIFRFSIFAISVLASFGLLLYYRKAKADLDKTIQEKLQQDSAIEQLKEENEHLEVQLKSKEKQLAIEAFYQHKNKEILDEVAGKLQEHASSGKEESSKIVKDLLRQISRTKDMTSSWKEFELRFLTVNQDFFEKLNKVNDQLSPNDRRLCAFLRLNMSSKEISAITGQSVNSVNVARIRLRKKLGLTNSSVGLVGFLASL